MTSHSLQEQTMGFLFISEISKERRKKMSMIKITFPDGAVKEFPKELQ